MAWSPTEAGRDGLQADWFAMKGELTGALFTIYKDWLIWEGQSPLLLACSVRPRVTKHQEKRRA